MMKELAFVIPMTLAIGGSARAQEVAPTVRVHVEGDPRAVLEMRDDLGWAAVCQAPCDRRVPLDASYRINGDGIQQSKKFVLPSTYGEARVEVAPAPSGLHVVGVVAVSLGAASFVAGLQTMLIAVFSESCSDCVGGFADTTAPNVAWALMGVGLLSMIGGGVLTATTRTQVSVSTADQASSSSAALRERPTLPLAPAVGVPLVSLSF